MIIDDNVPRMMTAGDASQWSAAPDGYSVSDFTFRYAFQSDDGQNVFAVTQDRHDGSLVYFVVKSQDSALWVAGTYYYQMYALDGQQQRKQVDKGEIIVLPNLESTQAITQNQRIFAAISAQLENRASDETQSVSINGKTVSSYPIDQLLRLHTYYRALVNGEINARRMQSGRPSRRIIRASFGGYGQNTRV